MKLSPSVLLPLSLLWLAPLRPTAAQTYTVTELTAGVRFTQTSTMHKMCLRYCVGKMDEAAALGCYYVDTFHCGSVTGTAEVSSGVFHAFLYRGGRLTDLDAEAGFQSEPIDVNAESQVTGLSHLLSGVAPVPFSTNRFHAFLYSKGQRLDLGTLPGDQNSEGTALNDAGDVVGVSQNIHAASVRAFLYHGNRMRDLNALIPAASGWVLQGATGINNRGQIVGTGLHGGKKRGYLLTPKL